MYILTALVAFAGSFVQSSSGFGYAIICMAIWPMFMPFYTASILEAIAAFFMVIYIAVRLWKFIDWKLLLPPVIMATVTSFLGVNTLMALDEDVLSKIMGSYFRYPRLSWLDGRCVQGPGTYSPRRG